MSTIKRRGISSKSPQHRVGFIKVNAGLAPPGKKWYCGACGKTTRDRSSGANGWEETCMLNSILISAEDSWPSAEEVEAYQRGYVATLDRSRANIDRLIQNLKDGVSEKPTPEVAKLLSSVGRKWKFDKEKEIRRQARISRASDRKNINNERTNKELSDES